MATKLMGLAEAPIRLTGTPHTDPVVQQRPRTEIKLI